MASYEAKLHNDAVLELNKEIVAEQFIEAHREELKHVKQDSPFDVLVKTIACGIFDKEIKLKKMFHKFDANGNGTLDVKEFRLAMESVGYDLTDDQLAEMFTAFDIDGNGKISFWEFVRSLGTT
eukprot:CAMPEP_0114158844 /NCGR_PEP_ID=MMETSP0043_2-20121206/27450_1 /TAXON_ID=464988 /ORGANISM="Hemiselmis andersenii, Strain CCMP644" /LENGTH=123 /DNA_ID=CAMNT_0001254663 /DNA_START=1 /DNA_END=369 /DNA_ORIENTATION=+